MFRLNGEITKKNYLKTLNSNCMRVRALERTWYCIKVMHSLHSNLVVSVYQRKSRELISLLLRRISSIGDTYDQHKKDLDYKPFLDVQLELVKRIITTERRISKLRKETLKDLQRIEETLERRKLLKLLGTTIAWILLEFDRPYIRQLGNGHNAGFISGKKGLKLEILALKAAFELENCAGVLHDITNCLRIGDLSVIKPKGILTLELKLTKRKKMDRRERRQKRKGEIVREFYDKGISTKIIPGMTARARTIGRHDKHNWKEISAVIKEGVETGYGISLVEECMIYTAFQNEIPIDELSRLAKLFKDPQFMLGCQDRHIDGIPSIMPFTCFELPLSYKEKLLFREMNFCVLLDVNSLRRIIEETGFHCKVLEGSYPWLLEVSDVAKGKTGPQLISYGLVNRLLYECLSVKTFLCCLKDMRDHLDEMLEQK